MDIHDMKPEDALKLTHRYHEALKVLHITIQQGKSPSVGLMESLEKFRQECEMASDHMLQSLGLGPADPAQIEIPLDGAA